MNKERYSESVKTPAQEEEGGNGVGESPGGVVERT